MASRADSFETYDTCQPWVIYSYGLTTDRWWPFWRSTHVLGRARVRCECCVCGLQEVVAVRIPRLGRAPEPVSGRHPERERFHREHAHPDRGAPMSWALPLRNLAVFAGERPLGEPEMRPTDGEGDLGGSAGKEQ